VVIPATPYDAKGLLIQSIRDDDPVIFLEHKLLYTIEGDVPEEPYAIPFGEANIVREGGDVTVVATGRMVHLSEQAAEELAGEGIECELIDLRTTSALDEDTILESVENTGRLVGVDESSPRCGLAADIISLAAREAFSDLKAPPRAVTPPHTPVPFSPVLEDAYVPSPDKIANAIRDAAGAEAATA
jgi:pyruvate dehydrogenase E1 component beta subunit